MSPNPKDPFKVAMGGSAYFIDRKNFTFGRIITITSVLLRYEDTPTLQKIPLPSQGW